MTDDLVKRLRAVAILTTYDVCRQAADRIEEPPALVIEEGKHYVTTRGNIVGPIKRQLSSVFPWGANGMEWGDRGNYFIDPRETKDFDIIAEHHAHGREVINE